MSLSHKAPLKICMHECGHLWGICEYYGSEKNVPGSVMGKDHLSTPLNDIPTCSDFDVREGLATTGALPRDSALSARVESPLHTSFPSPAPIGHRVIYGKRELMPTTDIWPTYKEDFYLGGEDRRFVDPEKVMDSWRSHLKDHAESWLEGSGG